MSPYAYDYGAGGAALFDIVNAHLTAIKSILTHNAITLAFNRRTGGMDIAVPIAIDAQAQLKFISCWEAVLPAIQKCLTL
jgi:hypothetical protein